MGKKNKYDNKKPFKMPEPNYDSKIYLNYKDPTFRVQILIVIATVVTVRILPGDSYLVFRIKSFLLLFVGILFLLRQVIMSLLMYKVSTKVKRDLYKKKHSNSIEKLFYMNILVLAFIFAIINQQISIYMSNTAKLVILIILNTFFLFLTALTIYRQKYSKLLNKNFIFVDVVDGLFLLQALVLFSAPILNLV